MSQRNRRVLAALGLAAALLLTLPAPARAAGLWEIPSLGLIARAWAWLENLGLEGRQAATPQRPAAVWEKEGSMIDPNGQAHPVAAPTAPTGSTTSPGGGN